MDFSFKTPLGIGEPGGGIIHALYPNPVSGTLVVNVINQQRSNLVLDVVDMLGQVVDSFRAGHLDDDKEAIRLDVSSLPQGTYLIRVRGSKEAPGKFVVLKK
jgi:hypothetical protein